MPKVGKTKKWEIFIVIGLIILSIFLSKFPTLYHALNTPKGYFHPKQTSWFDAWDINFQVSYLRFGQRKGVFLENTYTTTPHQGVFVYQYYTILGVINRLFKLDPFLLFHLATLMTASILILVYWRFVKLFLIDFGYQMAAFIMIALGGGLGWLPLFRKAADNILAGFTSLYAYERGHEAMISLLLLSSFYLIYRFLKNRKRHYLYGLFLTSAASISIHPPFGLLLFLVGLIVGFWQYLNSRKLTLFIYPVFLVVFALIYYLLLLANLVDNPGFSGVVGQDLFNIDTLSLLTGFGFIGLFIVYMLIFGKETKDEVIYLKILFFSQLLLLFAPFGFHLYFAKNLYALGVILGIYGVAELVKTRERQIQLLILLVFLSIIPRLQIFTQLINANKNNSFFFLRQDEGKALEFFSRLSADSRVPSPYRMGNYIPAFSDNRVYYGHKFQTPNAPEALRNTQLFYTKMNEEEQREFLKKNNISYIYYGLEEAKLRQEENLETENPFSYFPVVYQNDIAVIYAQDNSSSN